MSPPGAPGLLQEESRPLACRGMALRVQAAQGVLLGLQGTVRREGKGGEEGLVELLYRAGEAVLGLLAVCPEPCGVVRGKRE